MSAEGQAKELKAMYTNRHGERCSEACGQGRHAECTETSKTCNCTYRGLHKTMHRYLTVTPPAEAESSSAVPSIWQIFKHKENCGWATPLPTGEGYWGCTCGLDSLLFQMEDYEPVFPASQQVPQLDALRNHERQRAVEISDLTLPRMIDRELLARALRDPETKYPSQNKAVVSAASQQVDVSAIAEEIAQRCVRAQEYAKKTADEPIQGWEFSQIARSVLQKAMGGKE